MGEVSANPNVLPSGWRLKLHDGREVTLDRIEQYCTYSGMVCGLQYDPPRTVASAIRAVQNWAPHFHAQPAVIPATITQGIRPTPKDLQYSHVEHLAWQMLLPVTTFAIFDLWRDLDSNDENTSALVIWWQANFGSPDNDETVNRICALDWGRHAQE